MHPNRSTYIDDEKLLESNGGKRLGAFSCQKLIDCDLVIDSIVSMGT